MHYRKLSAAILLTCSAGMFPVYAAEIKEAPAADTHAAASVIDKHVVTSAADTHATAPAADTHVATPTPQNNVDAHSAVHQTNLWQAPAFTTIITAEEMEDNHYETVAEALMYAPGVTVTPGSVNTAHQVVRIDGDDRVAVFIDGRRQNLESGFSDGRATYDLDMTPPVMAIDRIEILHGAVGDA